MSAFGVTEQDKYQIRRHAIVSAARAAGITDTDWLTIPEILQGLFIADPELHGLLEAFLTAFDAWCGFHNRFPVSVPDDGLHPQELQKIRAAKDAARTAIHEHIQNRDA